MELTFTLQELPAAADAFIRAMGNHRIFAFDGPMGAGKTTFIAEVCRRMGVADDTGSPTFSIVNEYLAADGSPIYHFDFYRLESPQEALDMGVEDYFLSGELCLMEWADRLGTLLPEETVVVEINELPDGRRQLSTDRMPV